MSGSRRRGVSSLWSVALVLSLAATSRSAGAAEPREPLTVATFNIRYGTAPDGENHWSQRRELLFEALRGLDADVVGLQEALGFQIAELVEAVPRYAVVGVGRDDGRAAGEYSAILFDRVRLRVSDSGTFWFSDTPHEPGSATWGNRIPRIATWARFVDARAPDGGAFWMYNVHLDHESQPSRERSTALLARRIAERRLASEPVVVTGDFNAAEDNPAVTAFLASDPSWLDTFRVLHLDEAVAGTFSGFDPARTGGPKIDYVLVQPGTEVLRAEIVRFARAGRTASDHFPVLATIRFAAPAPP